MTLWEFEAGESPIPCLRLRSAASVVTGMLMIEMRFCNPHFEKVQFSGEMLMAR